MVVVRSCHGIIFYSLRCTRRGKSTSHAHRFHLLCLKTGAVHPLAPDPPVLSHEQQAEDNELSYSIQISDDYMGILFHSVRVGENELVIWNWKTGDINLVCSF
jgi:hypothetical protein